MTSVANAKHRTEPLSEYVGLKEAARLLSVHYQTVYRWVRSGRISAGKRSGQYVVNSAEIEQFKIARSSATPPPPPQKARLKRHSRQMQRALKSGDETLARAITIKLMSNGASVVQLIETVLVPPLVHIGDEWQAGRLDIYVEHRASAIVERILGSVTPNPRGRRRGTALVASLSGDLHGLPSAMATAALREDQWTVHHLGANIPATEVLNFVSCNQVDFAAISTASSDSHQSALQAKAELEAAGTPTLIGNSGSKLSELIALASHLGKT